MSAPALSRGNHTRSPLIAVPLHANWTEVQANPDVPKVQLINNAYLEALSQAGASPVLLPLGPGLPANLDWVDGLLLPGGIDIDPQRFGEDTHPTSKVDPEQDRLDLHLLAIAIRRQLPVLGICRGIQILNVGMGGTLIQDLPSQRPSEIGHLRQTERNFLGHLIRTERGSRLRTVLGGDEFMVNSFHHQAIAELAPPLRASALSEDGVVEGVEATGDGWVVGVQFHPEELVREHEFARRLFRAFVEQCAKIDQSAPSTLVGTTSSP
jgi:putative glutamine amidotransferase